MLKYYYCVKNLVFLQVYISISICRAIHSFGDEKFNPDPIYNTFGGVHMDNLKDIIQDRRKELRMTQKELASRAKRI